MLIGLTGRARAGKDTVCERIARAVSPEVVRHAFADKVYACAAACIGTDVETLRRLKTDPAAVVTLEVMDGPNIGRPSTVTVRQYLQNLGTEGHRAIFGDDFWVRQINPPVADGRIHVITDVRFDNEAVRVRELGGIVVRVLGPASIEETADPHASEQPVNGDLVDVYLDNSARGDGFALLDSQLPGLLLRAGRAVPR